MLRKPNKLDYTMVNSYSVKSLLNCLEKVCEKVAANILSEWCEINHILHESQTGSRRQRSFRDIVVRVICRVQGTCVAGKVADMLLMDIKGTLHHVSRNCLLCTMESMGTDGDLMKYTELFLCNRSVSLVIDGHQWAEVGVENRSTARITSVAHPVCNLPERCLQDCGKRG